MRWFWACLVATASCTSLGGLTGGEDPGVGPSDGGSKDDVAVGDAAVTDASVSDATPPTTLRCDPSKPFGSPELVSELDPTGLTGTPMLTSDELEVFYYWKFAAAAQPELRHARRVDRKAPWVLETKPASFSPDILLSLSLGGLKLYYVSGLKPFAVTRTSNTSAFGTPVALDIPLNVMSGLSFSVANGDDNVYYARIGPAQNESRIVSTPIFGFGFSASPVVDLPSTHVALARDELPIVNRSETNLYFLSERGGDKRRLWVSRRASKAVPFGAPTHLAELDEPATDAITWAADDDCEVMMNRASHIYVARRPPP